MTRSLRRRIDYQVLRWQARLDASWADRVFPWLVAAGMFVGYAALALARARTFDTGDDLAAWVQGAWLITEGHDAQLTVTGRHLLEPQLALGFYAVAQLTRVMAAIPALLVLQALAIALGAPAVWRLCRHVCSLRVGAATAAVVAYAAYPPLHQLNLADFHAASLALPALLWGGYLCFRGRWRWAVPLFVLAMAMRSDLGLTVAAIGLTLALSGRGRGGRRLALAGVAWTLVAQFGLQPAIGGDGFVHAGAFADYGDTALAAVWRMISHPHQVLADLVARENFQVLVGLLAPLAFLPVLAPRRLMPFVPVVALMFLVDVPLGGADGIELMVPAVVGVFLATPFALEAIGRRNIERVTVDRRIFGAVVLASLTFFVLDSPASPYERAWDWGGRDQVDQARLAVVDVIADDAAVRAGPRVLPELADRLVARPMPSAAPVRVSQLTAGVDIIVIDAELIEAWELDESDVSDLEDDLRDEGFDRIFDQAGVAIYRRDGA
ncbi:MAG: DUF2079 domain-containing protein [Acidimicrobiia bacterium]|nr:DUF2079 domain-containing protein [Acidimicrobiia bacterium]